MVVRSHVCICLRQENDLSSSTVYGQDRTFRSSLILGKKLLSSVFGKQSCHRNMSRASDNNLPLAIIIPSQNLSSNADERGITRFHSVIRLFQKT